MRYAIPLLAFLVFGFRQGFGPAILFCGGLLAFFGLLILFKRDWFDEDMQLTFGRHRRLPQTQDADFDA